MTLGVGNDAEQSELSHSLLMRMQNHTVTLENNLAGSEQANYSFIIYSWVFTQLI